MISYHDFIVFTDVVFNDTIELQGGTKLFLDARFSEKRLTQREVIIKSVPLKYEGEDISSYQAIIDPTIYFRNMYHHGKGDNNEVPGMKGCFKVPASMIVAIRKDDGEQWIGFGDNFIAEKIMDSNEEVKQGLIITEIAKPKELKGFATVVYPNSYLLENDIAPGDKVRFQDEYWNEIYLGDKHYLWLRSKDVLAKVG